MNYKPISLYFDGKASDDLSRYFDEKLLFPSSFNLLDCFVASRDEDVSGITYSLQIGKIEKIDKTAVNKTFSRYQILKNENK